MATLRIYYDIGNPDWQLFYFKGSLDGDMENLTNELFPDIDTDYLFPYYPREKVAFNDDGYVDINVRDCKYIGFYIKRKDGIFNYGGELSGLQNQDTGPLCAYANDTGYVWRIDTSITSQLTYYIKDMSPYVFADSAHTKVVPQQILVGAEYDDDTDDDNNFKVFLTLKETLDITNPSDNTFKDYNPVLYLLNKSFNIGDSDMDLSISSSDLTAQKADALNAVELNIANSLYKLGIEPEDFDEAAFLADVAGFKADRDTALEDTIDFLKSCLDRHAILTA